MTSTTLFRYPVRSRERVYGRHLNHDPRAHAYPVGVLPRSAIGPVDWGSTVPALDQGRLGSCTANAGTGLLATASQDFPGSTSVVVGPAGAAASHGIFKARAYGLGEEFAVLLYELTTRIDPFPGQYKPDDTGSDGPSTAKALRLLGLAQTYSHAFSVDAAKAAAQRGPLLWGTAFPYSAEVPDANGVIDMDPSSGIAGGHEMVITGYDPNSGLWTVRNSWGRGWGRDGFCYVTDAGMDWSAANGGDFTVLDYAPVPVPPAPPVPTVDAQGFWTAQKTLAQSYGLV